MINIKVLANHGEVTYTHNGKKQVKIVALSDIPSLFDTKISFDSGILPIFGETNAYGIQRIVRRDNSYIVMIQAINPFLNTLNNYNCGSEVINKKLKALKITPSVKFEDVVKTRSLGDQGSAYCYNNVYYPNLLMCLNLRESNGKLTINNSGVVAFKDAFITDTTELYNFPFSNTYKGTIFGQICWGSLGTPRLDSLAQSVGVLHTFLGGVMNRDLFQPLTITGGETLGSSNEVLGYLAMRSPEINSFPYNEINLIKTTTYKDLVAYTQQNWK